MNDREFWEHLNKHKNLANQEIDSAIEFPNATYGGNLKVANTVFKGPIEFESCIFDSIECHIGYRLKKLVISNSKVRTISVRPSINFVGQELEILDNTDFKCETLFTERR
ncbi:MAG TPA: hypothetical protein ENO20_08285 [Bacteroides sp.]|nr:hypothetical protein [Bacteroides sp.]